MAGIDICKKQLDAILKGLSTDPRIDARRAGQHFRKALDATDLGNLKQDLLRTLRLLRLCSKVQLAY